MNRKYGVYWVINPAILYNPFHAAVGKAMAPFWPKQVQMFVEARSCTPSGDWWYKLKYSTDL